LSPNGKKLANEDQVWDLDTGKLDPGLTHPRGLLFALDWYPDGKTLAGGHEAGSLLRWQVPSGKALPTSRNRGIDQARGIAWSPDGQQLAFSQGAPVGIWEPGSGKFLRIGANSKAANFCFGVKWSPDGKKFALLLHKWYDVAITDAATARFLRPLKGHSNHAQAAAWSPDSTKVASSAFFFGQQLLIHDVATGKRVASSPPGRSVTGVGLLAWSPDGTILASNGLMAAVGKKRAVGNGASVLFWHTVPKGLVPRALPGHQSAITVLAWSPKGTLLASGSHDKTVRLWDPKGKPVGTPLEDHQAQIRTLHWLAEDRLLSLDAEGVAYVWDLRNGQAKRSIKGLPGGGAISPNGRMLAAPFGRAVRLWDLDKARPLSTLMLLRMGRPIVWVAVSPDGHYRGSTWVEKEFVYVVRTDSGQDIFTRAEFASKFNWKNDPERVAAPR
jgi:WD40 repeat protein